MSSFFGNRGEWSEPYALFKLLADKKIKFGEKKLKSQINWVMPILSILRENVFYSYDDTGINVTICVEESGEKRIVSISEFQEKAVELLESIKKDRQEKNGSFSCLDMDEFLHKVGINHLTTKSTSKSDIIIIVHDVNTGATPNLGFSIKSELGSKATMINASQATNFIFKILKWDASETEKVNTISSKSKIKDRLQAINKMESNLSFHSIDNKTFKNNLVLIDSGLPSIIAEMVYAYYSGKIKTVKDGVNYLDKHNPNRYDQTEHSFYEYKVKRFLMDTALGMRPTEVWQGKFEATGGYLIVKEDGDVVCYHLYNYNDFADYLFENTAFETPSSRRHKFGKIYEENGEFFIKLNLQIRFR